MGETRSWLVQHIESSIRIQHYNVDHGIRFGGIGIMAGD